MAEIMTIKLGGRTNFVEEIPYGGGAKRSQYGWEEGMTEDQCWEAAQGWWRLEPGRAIRAKLALVLNNDSEVVAIGRIEGVVKGEDRLWLLGKQDATGYEQWLHKHVNRNRSQNPIAYFDEKRFVKPEDVTAETADIIIDDAKN
ncbi:protein-(glutamine-N5) methyltransferase [Bifidobacterium samirii]|uniref:Glutamine N5-methyltransferase n=1 Tax=Bifidobacterium samirii TaxID=2306974 RepID=A0A430FU44_9BIFI|nr:protein-(glutamine-N5) methyltransferase [Bifidobacterium samirii]RSX56532.1 glutamine N5-methyltransferase [Bifidobacterium samirii]